MDLIMKSRIMIISKQIMHIHIGAVPAMPAYPKMPGNLSRNHLKLIFRLELPQAIERHLPGCPPQAGVTKEGVLHNKGSCMVPLSRFPTG